MLVLRKLKPSLKAFTQRRSVVAPGDRSSAIRRRARNGLIWSVLAVIALQATLFGVINGPYPQLRDPTFEIKVHRLNQALQQSGPAPMVIVVLGSSVTCNAYDCKTMEQQLGPVCERPVVVYNMAGLGAGPLTQLLYLRRLLDRGIRPGHVCVEFSPQFFNRSVPDDLPRFPSHLLTNGDFQVIKRFRNAPEDFDAAWQRVLFPAYAHRLTIMNNVARIMLPTRDKMTLWDNGIDDRGWTELMPNSPEEHGALLNMIDSWYAGTFNTPVTSDVVLGIFHEMLELLEKEGISFTVVMVPQGPKLRECLASAGLEGLKRNVAEICRQNGGMLVDAREWLGEEMFIDSIHPHTHGASIFSRRLVNEFLLPKLIKDQQ